MFSLVQKDPFVADRALYSRGVFVGEVAMQTAREQLEALFAGLGEVAIGVLLVAYTQYRKGRNNGPRSNIFSYSATDTCCMSHDAALCAVIEWDVRLLGDPYFMCRVKHDGAHPFVSKGRWDSRSTMSAEERMIGGGYTEGEIFVCAACGFEDRAVTAQHY